MRPLSRDQALNLLKKNGTPDNVVEHCLTVSSFAREVADKIKSNGYDIDVDFVESAAVLHDIGRSKTHGIMHGIEGAKIMKDFPAYARVCENHIGGGISKGEAKALGLPERDYFPQTLEEKVISSCDKLVHGTRIATLEETLEKFRHRLGPNHPTISRIVSQDKQIRKLAGL